MQQQQKTRTLNHSEENDDDANHCAALDVLVHILDQDANEQK